MKNTKKIIALLLCAVLLVAGSVAGTLAYLTSKTDPVTNTFSAGNVAITLDETLVTLYGEPGKKSGNDIVAITGNETAGRTTANRYKLIPGHEYTKDPTIKVSEGSENCYILVKINNGLGNAATLNMSSAWAKVSEKDNESVWVYGTAQDPVAVSAADDAVIPFDKFTFGANADPADYENATIVVNAYAIQADGLDSKTAAELWAVFQPSEG